MGNVCSSSKDKLSFAETFSLMSTRKQDYHSLVNTLRSRASDSWNNSIDPFKPIPKEDTAPYDDANVTDGEKAQSSNTFHPGQDLIHTYLQSNQVTDKGGDLASAIDVLKVFKEKIESNKQKNKKSGDSNFRERPEFDKFPYSYLQYIIFNSPMDLQSFVFLIDNKETFPSSQQASEALIHDLCANKDAIELLRHLISSGEFPERFKNTNSETSSGDAQMKGSQNSFLPYRAKTPLQVACANANKLACQELCVSGLCGSNFAESAATMFISALEKIYRNEISMMNLEDAFDDEDERDKESVRPMESASALFINNNKRPQPKVDKQREEESTEDALLDILLCLLAQPDSLKIRNYLIPLSSPEMRTAYEVQRRMLKCFDECFGVKLDPRTDSVNLVHLAFLFLKSNSTQVDDKFFQTVLDNKTSVCSSHELKFCKKLFDACASGDLETVQEILITHKAARWLIDLEAKSPTTGETPLQAANPQTARNLLHVAAASSLTTTNPALQYNLIECIIESAQASCSNEVLKSILSSKDNDRWCTPLMLFCTTLKNTHLKKEGQYHPRQLQSLEFFLTTIRTIGDTDFTKELLLSRNTKDETAFHLVCQNSNSKEILKYFCEALNEVGLFQKLWMEVDEKAKQKLKQCCNIDHKYFKLN